MMKTLNDYMKMSYRMEIVEDKDEGGYVVSYPDLPGCVTCGETIEAAIANAADAKKAWIEAALEEGIEIHEPDNLEDYSGQFKLRIPRSLHRSLAEHSDMLLMCTDGLNSFLSTSDLEGIIRKYEKDPSKALDKMLKTALERGGDDNITIILTKNS